MEKDTEKLNSQKKPVQIAAKQMGARGVGEVWPVTLQGAPAHLLVAREPEHGHHRHRKLLQTLTNRGLYTQI